jgi:hypothetical protein
MVWAGYGQEVEGAASPCHPMQVLAKGRVCVGGGVGEQLGRCAAISISRFSRGAWGWILEHSCFLTSTDDLKSSSEVIISSGGSGLLMPAFQCTAPPCAHTALLCSQATSPPPYTHTPPGPAQDLDRLLPCIRFPLMTDEQLDEVARHAMCARSPLLQDLVGEALEARAEEAGGGTRPPRVRWEGACCRAACTPLACFTAGRRGAPRPVRCGGARLRLLQLPYLSQAPDPRSSLPLLSALAHLVLQAHRGPVSVQDKRHVRALTASERLASSRFQVGGRGGCGGGKCVGGS